jgi:hypothetical protein
VKCIPLSEILIEQGLKYVDFLSLDIEGIEVVTLANSDWDSVPVDLIVRAVETESHSREGSNEI